MELTDLVFWWPSPTLKLSGSTKVISLAYQWHSYHSRDSNHFWRCVQGTTWDTNQTFIFLFYHTIHWRKCPPRSLYIFHSLPCPVFLECLLIQLNIWVLLLRVVLHVSTACFLFPLFMGRRTVGYPSSFYDSQPSVFRMSLRTVFQRATTSQQEMWIRAMNKGSHLYCHY